MKINILSSTDRPGSNALKVSSYAKRKLDSKADVRILSLMDFPYQDIVGGRYADDIGSVDEYNEKFLEADGILFVIPEYNGGFPGVLKVFFDYLPFPKALNGMPVSMIGEAAGAFGALRPVEQFSQLLMYRNAVIYPERMYIQRVNDAFDEEQGMKKESLQKKLNQQLENFPEFVRKHSKELVNL